MYGTVPCMNGTVPGTCILWQSAKNVCAAAHFAPQKIVPTELTTPKKHKAWRQYHNTSYASAQSQRITYQSAPIAHLNLAIPPLDTRGNLPGARGWTGCHKSPVFKHRTPDFSHLQAWNPASVIRIKMMGLDPTTLHNALICIDWLISRFLGAKNWEKRNTSVTIITQRWWMQALPCRIFHPYLGPYGMLPRYPFPRDMILDLKSKHHLAAYMITIIIWKWYPYFQPKKKWKSGGASLEM
jgi:hypothetical protein